MIVDQYTIEYRKNELNKLDQEEDFITIKLHNFMGHSTKYFNIDILEYKKIKAILLEE